MFLRLEILKKVLRLFWNLRERCGKFLTGFRGVGFSLRGLFRFSGFFGYRLIVFFSIDSCFLVSFL